MDPDLTRALAGWADGKSFGLGLSAINALAATEAVGEFLHWRRTLTGLFADEPNVDERQWLDYYTSPKSLERSLLLEVLGSHAEEVAGVMNALRNPRRADKRSKLLAFGLILAFFMRGDRSEWLKVLPHLFDDHDAAPSEEDSISVPASFYLWVYVPCLLVYGIPPTKLLRKVSSGGPQAEKAAARLVRLDHRVVRHPVIQRWIYADKEVAPFRREKVRRWRQRTPFDKAKSSSTAMRVLAGYVSGVSELVDERLEARSIGSLIESLGNMIPSDLRAYLANRTADDWSREIRRNRTHFELRDKPDTSTFESVRGILGRCG